MSFRHICLLLGALAAAESAIAAAPTSAQLDQARTKGLAWLVTHQNGDGSWTANGGLAVQSTSAALDALANAGIKQGSIYSAGQAWLTNADAASVDSLARKTVALFRSGANIAPLAAQLLAQRNDNYKAWGAYTKYQASFPDSALAVDVFLVTGQAYADTGYTLGYITSKQNADGGWPYVSTALGAPVSRLIPAAYNVMALGRARSKGWGVDAALTNGVNWLVGQAKTDGSFAEDSLAAVGSPLETTLAYLALVQAKAANNAAAAAAQTTIDNALNALVNSQSADGSWTQNPFATALALQAMPATTLVDSNKNGVPDVVEAYLGGNPLLPNHQVASGNGQSVSGTTTAKLLSVGEQYKPFNYVLPNAAGPSPYVWSITSGYLPDGVSLDATTGRLSGVPTTAGTFNFRYNVQDASSANSGATAQIAIAETASDIPTMPQWGALLMAALLLMSMIWAHRKNRDV